MIYGQDPSIVKWLLDIGADFHRRCYGDFSVTSKPVSIKVNPISYIFESEVQMLLRSYSLQGDMHKGRYG